MDKKENSDLVNDILKNLSPKDFLPVNPNAPKFLITCKNVYLVKRDADGKEVRVYLPRREVKEEL